MPNLQAELMVALLPSTPASPSHHVFPISGNGTFVYQDAGAITWETSLLLLLSSIPNPKVSHVCSISKKIPNVCPSSISNIWFWATILHSEASCLNSSHLLLLHTDYSSHNSHSDLRTQIGSYHFSAQDPSVPSYFSWNKIQTICHSQQDNAWSSPCLTLQPQHIELSPFTDHASAPLAIGFLDQTKFISTPWSWHILASLA